MRSGRFEKQTAPVEVDMAQNITVRHCSIYDVPRGHQHRRRLLGRACHRGLRHLRHGAGNGRPRHPSTPGAATGIGTRRRLAWTKKWPADPELPLLDVVRAEHPAPLPLAVRPRLGRGPRRRFVTLQIYHNLCLNGGLKLREGYHRVVEEQHHYQQQPASARLVPIQRRRFRP